MEAGSLGHRGESDGGGDEDGGGSWGREDRAGDEGGTTIRVDPMALREVIGIKEKELQEMNSLRVRALEKAISDRDEGLAEAKEMFLKLREDFQYNLKLLEDRDAELERYDALFASMKAVMRDREGEVSELRVTIDELEARVKAEQKRGVELETYCADRVGEEKLRTEALRHAKDEELHQLRGACEEMRRDFLRQLKDKNDLVDTQRRDMGASFDQIVRQLEMEGSSREASLRAEVKRREQVEAGLREEARAGDVLRQDLHRRSEAADKAAKEQEKRRKELEWELEDVSGPPTLARRVVAPRLTLWRCRCCARTRRG